jgi:putative pyruvate formate lyase activating enzyme
MRPMGKKEKVKQAAETFRDRLKRCDICPHNCLVNRTAGKLGFCRTRDRPVISSYGPHYGEERELVGSSGSGTIFFTACNLKCRFCQNYDISQLDDGEETTSERLASLMLHLQRRGCHNINLVSPTHQLPMILDALSIATDDGLSVPIVYNSGGYEKTDTIRFLDGVIDIYMPDFKWSSNDLGQKYSGVKDYADRAKESLLEMHRQVGILETDEESIAAKGLLIRHLVMPGMPENSKAALEFIMNELSVNTYVNIMDQYHPAYNANKIPGIDRMLTRKEYNEIVGYAANLGLHRGFQHRE